MHQYYYYKLAAFVTIALFAFIAVVLILLRVDTYLKIKAIDDCAHISVFEQNSLEKNEITKSPVYEVYQYCLSDKGIR